jgi:hypothetical protein
VFVALQDIDRTFTRFAEAKLVVIDPVADQPAGVIPLPGKNPFDMQVVRHGANEKVYVALAGIFPGLQPQELSGGVAVVDAAGRTFERMALDDDAAGGNVSAVAVVGENLGYVIASDAAFVNRVLVFDPARGTVLRTLRESSELIPQLALDSRNVLAVPERRFTDPQVCLYRAPAAASGAETSLGCITLELPPFSIVALD